MSLLKIIILITLVFISGGLVGFVSRPTIEKKLKPKTYNSVEEEIQKFLDCLED